MKKFEILFLSLLWTAFCWAQPQMKFNKETNDFGTILWANPAVSEFEVTNEGNQPLQIKDVKTSCACTVADWTKTPIQPGQTGKITAVFDAKALGTFYKEVEVYSNISDEPVYLQMEGRVVASDEDMETKVACDIAMGDVKINRDAIYFDHVNKGSDPVEEIVVVNPSRAAFEPILMHVPEYLEVTTIPKRIPAGRSGRILVKLLTDKVHDVGLTQAPVYLSRYFGDKVEDANQIDVSVVLLPDFSNQTSEQLAAAPHLQLSSDEIVLPANKMKGKATVLISNTGKSNLNIDRLQVFVSAVSVSIPKKTLLSGESMKMKVSVDKSKLKKNRQLQLLMITNDPENAGKIITIKAD